MKPPATGAFGAVPLRAPTAEGCAAPAQGRASGACRRTPDDARRRQQPTRKFHEPPQRAAVRVVSERHKMCNPSSGPTRTTLDPVLRAL